MHVARSRPCGTFHGEAGRAHVRAMSGTLLPPEPSLASGSTCPGSAVCGRPSEGSQVNDGFGSDVRQDMHASSQSRRVSLTAASNPIRARRAGKFGLQTLSCDGQINDRVLRVKAPIDIPEFSPHLPATRSLAGCRSAFADEMKRPPKPTMIIRLVSRGLLLFCLSHRCRSLRNGFPMHGTACASVAAVLSAGWCSIRRRRGSITHAPTWAAPTAGMRPPALGAADRLDRSEGSQPDGHRQPGA